MGATEQAADHLVTTTDIARRCGVGLTAVSNWRARHPTFPVAMENDGVEWFFDTAVGDWLRTRRIPGNGLRPGEHVGATYADRFLATDSRPTSALDERDEILDPTWRALDQARADTAVEQFDEFVLAMLWLRLREPQEWSSAVRDASADVPTERWLRARSLSLPLPRSSVPLFADRALGMVRAPALRRLAQAVDGIPLAMLLDRGRLPELILGLLDRTSTALGRRGDHFTPSPVAGLMTALLDPDANARVHDPFCRAGELLVEAARQVQDKTGRPGSPRMTGRARFEHSLRLTALTTQLVGLTADLRMEDVLERPVSADTGTADVVLANPPFNMRLAAEAPWSADVRWRYGSPPVGNANFAWLQHVLSLLAPTGRAAVVMPNIAAFSSNPTESSIRTRMVADGAVEAVIALPDRLFPSTGIAVSLWILRGRDDRSAETDVLFVDASGLGTVGRRGPRLLDADDRERIVEEYHRWRTRRHDECFRAAAGLSASVARSVIAQHEADLNPRRHVVPDEGGLEPDAAAVLVRDLQRARDHAMDRLFEARAMLDEQLERLAVELVGDIPAQRRVSLGGICDLLAGPSRIDTDDRSGVAVLVPRNVRPAGIADNVIVRASADEAARMVRYRLEPGDVVGVRTGDLGRFAAIGRGQDGWLLGPGCLRLRPEPDVDPVFLAHVLSSRPVRDWIDRRAAGSAVRAISMRALGDLPVDLPPLAEQQRVAAVLRAIDAEAAAHEEAGVVVDGLREVVRAAVASPRDMTERQRPEPGRAPVRAGDREQQG